LRRAVPLGCKGSKSLAVAGYGSAVVRSDVCGPDSSAYNLWTQYYDINGGLWGLLVPTSSDLNRRRSKNPSRSIAANARRAHSLLIRQSPLLAPPAHLNRASYVRLSSRQRSRNTCPKRCSFHKLHVGHNRGREGAVVRWIIAILLGSAFLR